MRFTDEALEKVEKTYSELQKESGRHEYYMGLELKNGIGMPTIFTNNWQVCNLDDLDHMIGELQMMKNAIERATGVEF